MKKTHRSGLRQTLRNNNNNLSQSVMVFCRCFAKIAEMWEHLGCNYIFLTDTSPLHFSFFWSIFSSHWGQARIFPPLREESHSCNKYHITIISHLWGNKSGGSVCILCVWTNRKKMTRHSNMIEEEQGWIMHYELLNEMNGLLINVWMNHLQCRWVKTWGLLSPNSAFCVIYHAIHSLFSLSLLCSMHYRTWIMDYEMHNFNMSLFLWSATG